MIPRGGGATDDGHATAAADGWALDLSKVRGRARGDAPTARGNLHPPTQAQHCQNHRGPDPIGGVQEDREVEWEFELPDVVTAEDGPGGRG